MTKKDYVKIAAVIEGLSIGTLANTSMGGFVESVNSNGFHAETLIDSLCDMFEDDNSRFNKDVFIKACGFEAWDKLVMGSPIYS